MLQFITSKRVEPLKDKCDITSSGIVFSLLKTLRKVNNKYLYTFIYLS